MMTELDIVNAMLASTGTAPLTTNDTRHPYYAKAHRKLATVSREVQSKGWWFNTATRTLRQNTSGELTLPSTTLHADPVDTSSGLTVRGDKLYDLNNATYAIGKDVEVVFIDLVPIDHLPPTPAAYIKARAVQEFYLDEDGNQPKLREYKEARNEAWVALKGEHLRNADVNFFSGASFALMQRGVRTRRLPLTDS